MENFTLGLKVSQEKKALMLDREHCKALIEPVRKLAYDVSVSSAEREPYLNVYHAFENMARGIAWRKAANISVSMRRHIQHLQDAPLVEKRNVLQTMPVISAPVAAEFLGVKADVLMYRKNHCSAVFCTYYIGMASYAMNDLLLIADNPEWLLTHVEKVPSDKRDYKLSIPDDHIFVDWEVAAAYLDASVKELNSVVPHSTHPVRPYRLSDLEKIRVAKLNTSA